MTAPLFSVLAATSLESALVLGAIVGVGVLVLALGLYDVRFVLVGAMLMYASQLFGPDVLTPRPLVYAALALVLAGLCAVYRGRMPKFSVLATGIFPASFVYLALGIALLWASVDTGESITTVFSVLMALTFCWILLSACDPEEIRSAIRWTTGIVVVLSLIFVLVRPEVAIGAWGQDGLAQRWEGIMENPNALAGFTSVYFLAAPTLSAVMFALVPTVIMMLGTGTRSAALGLGVVAGPQILREQSRTVRRIVLGLAILVALPLLYSVFFSEGAQQVDITEGSLVRTTNTRAESWGTAVDSIGANLIGGVGLGNDGKLSEELTGVHSSLLRPMTELGLLALIPIGMILNVGLRAARAPMSPFRSVFGVLLIIAVFEGYVFAGGSFFYVLMILTGTLMLVDSGDDEVADDEPAVEGDAPRRVITA
jgi:hypothetical protein